MESTDNQLSFPLPAILFEHLCRFDNEVLNSGCKLLYIYLLEKSYYENILNQRTNFNFTRISIDALEELSTFERLIEINLLTLERLGFIRIKNYNVISSNFNINCVIDVRIPKNTFTEIEKVLHHRIYVVGNPPPGEVIELKEQSPTCTARQFNAYMKAKDELIVKIPNFKFKHLLADFRITRQAKLMYILLYIKSEGDQNIEICASTLLQNNESKVATNVKPLLLLGQLAKTNYISWLGNVIKVSPLSKLSNCKRELDLELELNDKRVKSITSKEIHILRLASALGDAESQTQLALLFDKGCDELPQCSERAADLFARAANKGYAEAQYQLGMMYTMGYTDGSESIVSGEGWLEKAANQGHLKAQSHLDKIDECFDFPS